MFLAAFILAWKYTQERSYSLRAWAQISGLSSTEINANEVVFLSTIDWRLYIPNAFSRRWTASVLYYAKLPDRALPDSLLNCAKEGRDWPFRLLLLESSCGHLGIQDRSVTKLPVLFHRVVGHTLLHQTTSLAAYMPSSLSAFTLFPELAAELRLEIWRHVCHSTRVIEVRYNEDENRFVSSSRLPAILHVSRESRSEALRMYKLCFDTPSAAPHIYFRSSVDILYFPRRKLRLEEPEDDRSM